MNKKITAKNLPDLGVEPFKRLDSSGTIKDVLYCFLNGSTISINFDTITGEVEQMVYNGMTIPNNARLKLVDGSLHVILPTI